MGKGTVCIIGLGYVGLPLACLCAEKGFRVLGLDINRNVVELVKEGKSPITDQKLEEDIANFKGKITVTSEAKEALPHADTIIVCVPTPVTENRKPDLSLLERACISVSKHLKKGQLVIIESTIYPETIEKILKPILEKSGLRAGKDFYLATCPERFDPGNNKWTLEKIPRVLGALSKEGVEKAKAFYGKIIEAEVKVLNSVKAVEATKVVENSFRDINIAFINEIAKSFDKMGIDVKEVIEGASTKPFGFTTFYPGPGVGGHCIPVDPYYLIEKAEQEGFNHRFLKLAREINDAMPEYVVSIVEESIKGFKGKKPIIGVLGVTYKANVDDTRESPALKIIEKLKEKEIELRIFDPIQDKLNSVESFEEAVNGADCIVLLVEHNEFLEKLSAQNLEKFEVKSIVDARNVLDKEHIKEKGINYKGIGRGK